MERGTTSEKRELSKDPAKLKLDFDGLDMSKEKLELVKEALEEIKTINEFMSENMKRRFLSGKMSESFPRIEEHIYPKGYKGAEDDWILFEDTETSEHLEQKPTEVYVRVTIRHNVMRKDTKTIVTAPT